MPTSYDKSQNRVIRNVIGLGGGLNKASPARGLQENQSPYINNARVVVEKISPSKTLGTTDFTPTDETVYGLFIYWSTTPYIIALEKTKVYVKASGSAVAKTPSTPFTDSTTPMWDGFTMLHSDAPVMVVNNRGLDKPHYWDGGAGLFLILTNAPLSRCLIGHLGSLYSANNYSSGAWHPNRLEWSDYGDITTWSGITSGDLYLTDEGDDIYRLGRYPGRVLGIFRRHSIYLGLPTGDYSNPIAEQPLWKHGIYAPNTLQPVENAYIFMGDDDVYIAGQANFESVGLAIRQDLFRNADPDKLFYAWSYMDKRAKEYYLVTDMKDGTRRGWIFNWEQKTWTHQDMTGYECLCTWWTV